MEVIKCNLSTLVERRDYLLEELSEIEKEIDSKQALIQLQMAKIEQTKLSIGKLKEKYNITLGTLKHISQLIVEY